MHETFHKKFQPTLPMRGATRIKSPSSHHDLVSTHAPHAGSDSHTDSCLPSRWRFQPTLPMRGATNEYAIRHPGHRVSTHAPHAGSDSLYNGSVWHDCSFNPRSPCGERPKTGRLRLLLAEFQPTLPMRGATDWNSTVPKIIRVSTHAPHAGSDY